MHIRTFPVGALCATTFTLLFINIKLNSLFEATNNSNLNLFYFLLPLLFIILPKYKSQLKSTALLLFSTFATFNIIANWRFGFNFESIRIVIAALAFFTGYSLARSKTSDKISSYFNTAGIIALIAIIVRFLIYPVASVQLLQGNRNFLIDYPALTTGGHNIEATYLVFLAILTSNRKISIALLILTTILSIMYMSRVGLILIFLVSAMAIYRRASITSFICIIATFALVTPLLLATISPKTFERFTNIQQEIEYGDEGIGRLGLFNGATILIKNNIFGYGVGNTIPAMEEATGLSYKENNVHNIYLQILLDLGIISFTSFTLFSIWIFYNAIRTKFHNKFLVLSSAYLLIGLIQFTGLDALGWLCIGLAYPYMTNWPVRNDKNTFSGNSK
ncbi:O-antigen ligase [Pseudomonas citronellolis]|uniref:O-antigen ligase family protein n=1 Tax=Pseudomonas citronellolis TaxID=53408 RepID=UPI00209E37DF|nr:O-antigen ligase family protein [Pseudomonas citronellolis]MCP1641860.1 O-antigen ligase [Pseudomonas citronellolis]MCP1664778.1 O-antigen ligase [Pseudomonas citronellolis]MCP1695763.1 O-antigen ligase [Pseudomonas citronellolis]MCP1702614.1 O-antigen ligase [Pseudomonas citronellolis]MCP1796499.1 O-antigen ligase [Pseudomonas citronellolis]